MQSISDQTAAMSSKSHAAIHDRLRMKHFRTLKNVRRRKYDKKQIYASIARRHRPLLQRKSSNGLYGKMKNPLEVPTPPERGRVFRGSHHVNVEAVWIGMARDGSREAYQSVDRREVSLIVIRCAFSPGFAVKFSTGVVSRSTTIKRRSSGPNRTPHNRGPTSREISIFLPIDS
jgi:hypothetical protein